MADRFVIDKKDRVDLVFDFTDILVDDTETISGTPVVTVVDPGVTTPLATVGTVATDSTGKKVIQSFNPTPDTPASVPTPAEYPVRVDIESSLNISGSAVKRKFTRSFLVLVRENL